MASRKIHVFKPFKLNVLDVHTSYGVGVHDVPEDVANHWYVKAHSDPVGEAVELPPPVKVDRDAEIAAAMAAFEQYEPDAPGAPLPARRGRPPKGK